MLCVPSVECRKAWNYPTDTALSWAPCALCPGSSSLLWVEWVRILGRLRGWHMWEYLGFLGFFSHIWIFGIFRKQHRGLGLGALWPWGAHSAIPAPAGGNSGTAPASAAGTLRGCSFSIFPSYHTAKNAGWKKNKIEFFTPFIPVFDTNPPCT